MRTAASLLSLCALLLPLAARADVEDLSGAESRRARKPNTFAVRAEGGTEYSPYGTVGGCFSYFRENPLGGFEIEAGAGATFPGVTIGLAARQLFGEAGDYFAFELSIAGNTVKKLGADVPSGRLGSSSTWSSLAIGFEHRAGLLTFGIAGGLSFLTSFDLVPHGMLHGGIGLSF